VWAHWLLLVLYGSVGAINLARGVLGFVVGPVIAAEAPMLHLLSALYVAWSVVFVGISVARLLSAASVISRSALSVAVLYQATLWTIKLVWERASYARTLWPRDVALTVAFIGVVLLLTRVAESKRSGRQRR
jgi:hypothetical protein